MGAFGEHISEYAIKVDIDLDVVPEADRDKQLQTVAAWMDMACTEAFVHCDPPATWSLVDNSRPTETGAHKMSLHARFHGVCVEVYADAAPLLAALGKAKPLEGLDLQPCLTGSLRMPGSTYKNSDPAPTILVPHGYEVRAVFPAAQLRSAFQCCRLATSLHAYTCDDALVALEDTDDGRVHVVVRHEIRAVTADFLPRLQEAAQRVGTDVGALSLSAQQRWLERVPLTPRNAQEHLCVLSHRLAWGVIPHFSITGGAKKRGTKRDREANDPRATRIEEIIAEHPVLQDDWSHVRVLSTWHPEGNPRAVIYTIGSRETVAHTCFSGTRHSGHQNRTWLARINTQTQELETRCRPNCKYACSKNWVPLCDAAL